MLNKKQIVEIKEHLDRAQNPIFFYDNDPDGLCSYVLLRKYCGKGMGIPIRAFPEMTRDYFRRVNELGGDYIFILDKPVVSSEFFEEVDKFNIPVVWIDHHKTEIKKIPKFVHYYNPLYSGFNLKEDETFGEPVTALCYQISERKEDIWLAIIGAISDKFMPSFYSKFLENYPELGIETENAFEVVYGSEIGKMIRLLSFGLKDRTTNIINMQKFLVKANNPYDLLDENSKNSSVHKRYREINKKYQLIISKARASVGDERLLFFQYGGDLSISSEVANELSYLYPRKLILVVYVSGINANISGRGKEIRELVLKSIEGLEGASGGGHEEAVGARVRVEDLEIFRNRLEEFRRNRKI